MSSDYTVENLIAGLASDAAVWRKDAALVIGDWLYPRGGLSSEEVWRMHQALLTAAAVEKDEEAIVAQLQALARSSHALVGLLGWDRLVERAPRLQSEPQSLALALLSISGETALADRLEDLAAHHPDFNHGATRDTIALIRSTADTA